MALGLNLCAYMPRKMEDEEDEAESTLRLSNAASSVSSPAGSGYRPLMPATPTPTSSGITMSKSVSRYSKVRIFFLPFFSIFLSRYCNFLIS